MRSSLARLLGAAGWAVLGLLAALGVGLSVLVGLATSSLGGTAVSRLIASQVQAQVAGRLEVEAVAVLPRGGLELRGLRFYDPDGHLVLQSSRARLFPDLGRLRSQEVGVEVELDAPSILLEAEPDGSVSLARAFAPAPATSAEVASSWTLRLARLTVRGGELWWRAADRTTAAELTGLELDAEGVSGPAGAFLALRLRAAVLAPTAGPLEVEAAARLRGDRFEIPVLRTTLGPSALDLLGDGDLATGAFRAAVTRLDLAAVDVRRLAPAAAPAGDLVGAAYAESDGRVATIALELRPGGAERTGGAAIIAAAARLPLTAPALGFDVALSALDPSRLLAQALPGRLTLTARGAAAGHRLADGRGWLALEVAPSQVRGGELGPVTLLARADRGRVAVTRLEARLPGLSATGGGHWVQGGAVEADLLVDATDLARLWPNLSALTGLPLPDLGGRLRARVVLGGTATAPTVKASGEIPLLTAGPVRMEAASFALEAAGPLAALTGRLTGAAPRASVGASLLRGLAFEAALGGGEGTLSLSGTSGELGTQPVSLLGRLRLTDDRQGAQVRALTLAWPGERLALVRPALVTFAPPSVDRLELAGGPRRIILAGGLRPDGALDLRLELARLQLADLPSGLFPPGSEVRGELSLEARATGTASGPVVASHLTVAGGQLRGIGGLVLRGDVGWTGAGRRLTADLHLVRAAGGALDVSARLPVPLAGGRPGEPLSLLVEAAGWPAEVVRQFVDLPAAAAGRLGGSLVVSGTAAAPQARMALALDEASLDDPARLGGVLELEQMGAVVRVTGAARIAGEQALSFEGKVPLDLADLLRRPEATVRNLRRGPLEGTVEVPGLDLALLAGRGGLPERLAGRLTGRASLGGSVAAPRGRVSLTVSGGAMAGYTGLAGRAELIAVDDRTSLTLRASIDGAEALRLDAALATPVDRLLDPEALRTAPLSLQATVPPLALARAAGPVQPLNGTVSASVSAQGTLARLEGRLELAGEAVVVEGRPLGDVKALVRAEALAATAELSIHPTAGGVLLARATLAAPLGLDSGAEALGRAPATLRITSEQLDLGFLPALLPGVVRVASGALTVDLAAAGPMAGLRPSGTVKLADGTLAVAEWGAWSAIAIDASLGDGAIELSRLEARHGAGRLSGHLSVHGMGTPLARLEGQLTLKELPVSRAGMEFVTMDAVLGLEGTWSEDLLDTTVSLPGGTLRLPKKSPRTLQSLEVRKDILVGRPRPARASWFGRPSPAGLDMAPGRPFEMRCHLMVPGKLFVKGENPTVDVELKGDSTWRLAGGVLLADGRVDLVRGTLEPISGRIFHLERGRLSFGGGGWKEGQLDVVARYDNPAAVVTVTIGGSVAKPTIALVSLPALDEQSIAMLIATGRSEIKLNTSGVGTLTAQEAGTAAASAAVAMAFKGLLADKLPVDQVSLDAATLRAGKYLTDRLFVGYVRRFEAKPEKGENTNEVRAEYQLSPRWTFELRYGDAQAGDGSLMWTKEY